MQITLSLAVVLGFIFLIGWLLRRMRQVSGVSRGNLRVIDEVMLGARERVVTLETAGVRLVLGVAEGRISLLHRYSSPPKGETSNEIDNTALTRSPPRGPRWLQLLQQGLGR